MAEQEHIKKTFMLCIASPQGKLFEGEAMRMIVPQTDGELGILPKHTTMVALLKKGPILVTDATGKEMKISIADGIVQVNRNDVVVLATPA